MHQRLRRASQSAPATKLKAQRQQRFAMIVERLEARQMLAAQVYDGALNGKIVYTSAGHGWQYNSTLARYATDRGDNNEIVEDFGNQDQLAYYADYLLRAGATVVPMRPVGHQTREVVLDNDSPGVTFTGAWVNSIGSVYYDEDYGADDGGNADAASYRFASISSTETAVATYTPNIQAAGFYPVYTWVADSTNRTNQLYRVNSSGGATEIRVDHRRVGKGWVYLGTYHFAAGAAGNVQISNQSTAGGSVVIADAIRFGNGMGDVPSGSAGIDQPGGVISGYSREDENSLHWLWRAVGEGNSAATVTGGGNVSAPSRMAEHMNAAPFGQSVYIGFHSNASNGTGRGALGLIDSDQGTPNQSSLALYTGRQINQDMQALNGQFEHSWSARTTHSLSGGFGEIDEGLSAEMDMTIIEVGFHDNVQDAALMRDPKVRNQLGRSTYEATLEYFDAFGGLTAPASQPDEPQAVRATANANGSITLNWTAPAARAGGPGTATGYRIYTSRNGYGFSDAVQVGSGATTYTIPAASVDGNAYYFKIAAINAGGESPASAVVGARRNGTGGGGGTNRILVVNGFDRFERSQNERQPYAFTGDALTDRVRTRYNNTFDYTVQAGEAIEAYNTGGAALGFDSAQNDHVISGAVNLANYQTVIWLSGEESTDDESFNTTEQTKVSTFLNGGGRLFVSGSEIGWDLDGPTAPTAADVAFYNNTLHADFVADDANTYTASGATGSIFAGVALTFDNGANSNDDNIYNVRFPDKLAASAGSTLALNYTGIGSGGAATQWANLTTSSGARVVNIGFPFETITTTDNRNLVMTRVLNFFQTALSTTPTVPDLAAATDSGSSSTDNITNRDNSSAAKNLQFLVNGTIAGATVRLYAKPLSGGSDIFLGSVVAGGTSATVTTTGAPDLLDGTRLIYATQQETNKSESPASTNLSVVIDTAAPVVTSVFASSTAWNANFLNFLDSSGQGEAAFGYRLNAADHADELPWTNLNRISIRFSEHVNIAADDLVVRGINNATYAPAASSAFSYNPTTFTATWTLATTGIANDKLLLDLDADAGTGVTDAGGNALDGEWTNPATSPTPTNGGADTFPSGDGTPGGDFRFRLNVLPGDVNRNGSVLGNDVNLVKGAQGFSPGVGLYTIFKDVNGSASILGNDVILTRARQGTALPAGEPTLPAGFASLTLSSPKQALKPVEWWETRNKLTSFAPDAISAH